MSASTWELPGALRKLISLPSFSSVPPSDNLPGATQPAKPHDEPCAIGGGTRTAADGEASLPPAHPSSSSGVAVTSETLSSVPTAVLSFGSYPSPPPHLRYLELRWGDGKQDTQQKVAQLLEALDAKGEELSGLIAHILMLLSHTRYMWEENRDRSKRYDEARQYFMKLDTIVRQIRVQFDAIRRMEPTNPDKLGFVALGGYRSMLRVMEEPLRLTYNSLVQYMGITQALVAEHLSSHQISFEAFGEESLDLEMAFTHLPLLLERCNFSTMDSKFAEFHDSMTTTFALLEVLVKGLTVVAVLPPSADHPYEALDVVDSILPESVPWRFDLLPYHIGYEYNSELLGYVRQLNIFFASTGKSYTMGNFVTRQAMFSSFMLKYALSPKEAARQAVEFKRSLTLDMLRSVWDVLEDPMYHWFAVSLGYSTNQKIAIDRLVEIDFSPSFTKEEEETLQRHYRKHPPPAKIRARFLWDPPSTPSPSYFASLSAYFSFLAKSPSLPPLPSPTHWYPTSWRMRDDDELEGDDDEVHHPLAFSPSVFSPASSSFHSPPSTPATVASISSLPSSPRSSVSLSSPVNNPPSASFGVFSSSSLRSLFGWKKDEEESHIQGQPAVDVLISNERDESCKDERTSDGQRMLLNSQHTEMGDKDKPECTGDSVPNIDVQPRLKESGEKSTRVSRESENASTGQCIDGPCIIFHVHGGGFVSQSSQSHLSYLKQWAALTGIPILTVDYSLAPEHPYPTAHEQCYAAYKWVLSHYHELGIASAYSEAPLRVVMVGDSAGGNLVAGLTLRAISEGITTPVGVVLVYPALCLSLAASISRTVFSHDPVLNFPSTALCLNSYVPEHRRSSTFTDPYISPSMAPSSLLAKFPPTHIAGGGLDPLLDDALHFAHRLQKEHRPMELRIYDNLPHGFMNVSQTIPSAKFAIVDLASALTKLMFAPPEAACATTSDRSVD